MSKKYIDLLPNDVVLLIGDIPPTPTYNLDGETTELHSRLGVGSTCGSKCTSVGAFSKTEKEDGTLVDKCVSVGYKSRTDNWGSVAIGFGARATKAAVAIGHSDDSDGEPIYDSAYAADYAVAIGTASAKGARSISIGQDSHTNAPYSIALGNGPEDKGNRCEGQADIVIGQGAKSTGGSSGHVAIGYNAVASDAAMTVLGSCNDPKKIFFGSKSLYEIITGAI